MLNNSNCNLIQTNAPNFVVKLYNALQHYHIYSGAMMVVRSQFLTLILFSKQFYLKYLTRKVYCLLQDRLVNKLNLNGFKKVPTDQGLLCFQHNYFKKDSESLLNLIVPVTKEKKNMVKFQRNSKWHIHTQYNQLLNRFYRIETSIQEISEQIKQLNTNTVFFKDQYLQEQQNIEGIEQFLS